MDKISKSLYLDAKTHNQVDSDFGLPSIEKFNFWALRIAILLLVLLISSIVLGLFGIYEYWSFQASFFSGLGLILLLILVLYYRYNRILLDAYAENEAYMQIQQLNWNEFNQMSSPDQHKLISELYDFEEEIVKKQSKISGLGFIILSCIMGPFLLFDSFEPLQFMLYLIGSLIFMGVVVYLTRIFQLNTIQKRRRKLSNNFRSEEA